MKTISKSIISSFLAIIMLLSIFPFSTASAMETTREENEARARLPEWLPDDAPLPAPNSEVTTVYFYIDENNNAVIYDPLEQLSSNSGRTSVSGNGGTATIYWTNNSTVYWSITTNAGGFIIFHGAIATNNAGYKDLNKSSSKGIVDGTASFKTKKKYNNIATLNGYAVDSKGISITMPQARANIYYD